MGLTFLAAGTSVPDLLTRSAPTCAHCLHCAHTPISLPLPAQTPAPVSARC